VSRFTRDRYSIRAVAEDCAKNYKREQLAVAGIGGGGLAEVNRGPSLFPWPGLGVAGQLARNEEFSSGNTVDYASWLRCRRGHIFAFNSLKNIPKIFIIIVLHEKQQKKRDIGGAMY
jgi:hypothetical protein